MQLVGDSNPSGNTSERTDDRNENDRILALLFPEEGTCTWYDSP